MTYERVIEALQRIKDQKYVDVYGSKAAVPRYLFDALQDEVADLRLVVRFLAVHTEITCAECGKTPDVCKCPVAQAGGT